MLQGGSGPRIPQLQGQVPAHSSIASSGSVPRIPSSIHTPTGVYGAVNPNQFGHQGLQSHQKKNTKNPDLPIFSGETPTPKGEVEYDNYIFQLQMLRSSYTDDAVRNAIVATVRTQAKMAIHAIGYGSSLDAMIKQLQDRFRLGETVDLLGQEFHQLMQQPKEKVGEFVASWSINLDYCRKSVQVAMLRINCVIDFSMACRINLESQSGFCILSRIVI